MASETTGQSPVDAVASHLHAEHQAKAQYAPLTGEHALADLDAAYAAQEALVALWLEDGLGPVSGYKIALTSKPIQELCGVDQPCGGILLASRMLDGPATVSLKDFQRLGIEFELAVRLGKDLGPDNAPFDVATVRPAIDAVMPAFELIEDRAADYGQLDAISMVADNAWNGGVVLGKPVEAWQHLDLETTPVSLDMDGQVEASVTGAAMGNPLASVAWIANLLAGRGQGLRRGMIIMTGSTLATKFPTGGEAYSYAIDGLGAVSLKVDA